MVYALDPNNSVIKRLWCTYFLIEKDGYIELYYKLLKGNTTFMRRILLKMRLSWSLAHCNNRQLQLHAPSDWRPGGRGFNPRRGRQHSFVEIDHEIFSTVILSLPLIQEGQLSVSGERMCTILVNRLED